MEQTFRSLSELEKELLEKLLGEDFDGRAAIGSQVDGCLVRRIDESGSLEFKLRPSSPTADVSSRVPVEAEGIDIDGVKIHILVHVVEGKISELEIYREDGQAVKQLPLPRQLCTLVLPPPPEAARG